MDLSKHTAGTALTPAEQRQRKDAARARWGVAGSGVLAGAALGAGRRAWTAPREMADALATRDAEFSALHDRRRASITDSIRRRLRVSPDPAAPNIPVVGNATNMSTAGAPHIYDYQIARRRQQMQRTADPAQVKVLESEIRRLTRLAGRAPRLTARTETMRFRNRAEGEAHLALLDAQIAEMDRTGQMADAVRLEMVRDDVERRINESHPVRAHGARAYRQGDTNKQLTRRIATERGALNQRSKALLGQLNQRTAQLRPVIRAQTVTQMERLLRQRMAGAGAIGAAVGLTAAGIGLLAHHLVHTSGRRRLAKATDATPQASIGKGMAETFRQWIDRLLGRTAGPFNLGDAVAAGIAPGLTQAFANGATQPPLGQDPQYHIDVDFDQLNPSVRRHMADYALDRIVEITNQQREAIRSILMQHSVLQGIGPRDVARLLRESIGLTPYQMTVVQAYRTELISLDPAALERRLRDARYDRTVKRAIETNTPLSEEQVNAMVDAYYRRMLALRAETIARTESIRATSYGAVARAQDVLDQHDDLDVVKRWIATDDERTRPTHRDLDGKEVLGMETPFRSSAGNHIRWPIDDTAAADECINCRCSIGFRFIPRSDRASAQAAAR